MFIYKQYKIAILVVTLIYLIIIYKYYYERHYGYFKPNIRRNEQHLVDVSKVTHYELVQNMSKEESKERLLKNNITNATTKNSNNGTTEIVPKRIDPFMCFKNFTKSSLVVNNVSDVEIKPGRTIFFLETSCRSNVMNQITLNGRQACAIESAALSHPNLDVVLLVLSSNVLGSPVHPVVNILSNNYKNIRILHVNIDRYFKGTPVEGLHTSGRMLESSYPMVHMSDVLRYITMWKYGGIYLDLDVLIVKNLEDLGPNFSGLESSVTIAAGIMGFDAKSFGHYWAESILNQINSTYQPNAWSYNGLQVLQMQFEKVCNTTSVTQMTRENCQGFSLLPKLVFYEIDWSNNLWKFYFESNHKDYVMNIMAKPEVKAAHLWNKLSHEAVPEKNSAYRVLAAKYCPHVYSITENNF